MAFAQGRASRVFSSCHCSQAAAMTTGTSAAAASRRQNVEVLATA